MSIGIHVSRSVYPELHRNIEWAAQRYRCRAVQIFLYGPHNGTRTHYDAEALRGLGMHIYVHSAYVTPWGSPGLTRLQLSECDRIGAAALVLHLPKRPPNEIAAYVASLSSTARTPVALEMRAMHPGPESYESPEKINALAAALQTAGVAPSRAMICLDTAHIYACGARIRTSGEVRAYIGGLSPLAVGYMRLLHLNGNQYCDRVADKHAPPHGQSDCIWRNVPWRESGCREFAHWYLGRGCDIILEQAMGDDETLAIQQKIIQGV